MGDESGWNDVTATSTGWFGTTSKSCSANDNRPRNRYPKCSRTEAACLAFYDASRTSNSILTSSLALTPAFPGGLIPKSVCFTVVAPV